MWTWQCEVMVGLDLKHLFQPKWLLRLYEFVEPMFICAVGSNSPTVLEGIWDSVITGKTQISHCLHGSLII